MSVNINLKDGSKFKLKIKAIKLIFVEKNKLKIDYKNENIIFEPKMLESFDIFRPIISNRFNEPYVSYGNILTTILTNILQNSNQNL